MTGQDLINYFRGVIAEPYQDRINDDTALMWLSQASRKIAERTLCFEGRKAIQLNPTTVPFSSTVMEVDLPCDEIARIKRVYMVTPGSFQRLKHTSIPQMEGDQIRLYDSSGTNFSPQWVSLPAEPYPIGSCYVGAGYSPLPMWPGSPPAYYLRGITRIGVVPAPIAPATLCLDIHPMPANFLPIEQLPAAEQTSPFPFLFIDALCFTAAAIFYHSDQSVGSDSLEADALVNADAALKDCISYTDNFNEDDPQGPQLLTHRTFFEAQRLGAYW
jgi:hypothetical protein